MSQYAYFYPSGMLDRGPQKCLRIAGTCLMSNQIIVIASIIIMLPYRLFAFSMFWISKDPLPGLFQLWLYLTSPILERFLGRLSQPIVWSKIT